MFSTRSSGSSRGSTSSRNVRRGSSALTTVSRVVLGAVRERDAGRPAVLGDDASRPATRADDLGAERLRRAREHLGEAAVAALVEGPRAELAVVLADRVVQQHEPGALRARPDLGADDARRGEVALEHVGLEVVVEEVRGAAGQQPDGVVEHPLVELREARARATASAISSSGSSLKMSGGTMSSSGLMRLADHLHVVAVLVVGVGVVLASGARSPCWFWSWSWPSSR